MHLAPPPPPVGPISVQAARPSPASKCIKKTPRTARWLRSAWLLPVLAAALARSPVLRAQGREPAPVPRPVIVIDPGHPSENGVGAQGHGVAEVHVAWEVAMRLRAELAAVGYDARVTRAAERQTTRNAERARVANDAGAALMVRLHCDVGSGTGFTLYFPDRQGTAEGRTGPTRAVMDRSRKAALVLDSAMAAELAPRYLRDGGILGDSRTAIGARQGALTASIFSRVPVVTVEMAVLTDAADARFIASPDGQRRMAHAIAAGIARYVPHLRHAERIRQSAAGMRRPPPERGERR